MDPKNPFPQTHPRGVSGTTHTRREKKPISLTLLHMGKDGEGERAKGVLLCLRTNAFVCMALRAVPPTKHGKNS